MAARAAARARQRIGQRRRPLLPDRPGHVGHHLHRMASDTACSCGDDAQKACYVNAGEGGCLVGRAVVRGLRASGRHARREPARDLTERRSLFRLAHDARRLRWAAAGPATVQQGTQQPARDRRARELALKMTFKALRNVSLNPWPIGKIVARRWPSPHRTRSHHMTPSVISSLLGQPHCAG